MLCIALRPHQNRQKSILNEMVAVGAASDPHDFNGKEQDLSISKLSSAAFNITLLLPHWGVLNLRVYTWHRTHAVNVQEEN